ncbi:peptidoglycan-binding protein [Herbivorax sp. ANBcel31]|uniref:peptidoglycan-binding domain-containing protein n=1 Tax=Herbivorax sp. ANBcel31 TaxID=3069754 RepID=UPI0027B3DB7B|nr:peptidoglycan-binding protein [Herbivorax sp. ANBcel31]MDQ2084964.1 peptidoglycan-binding protein [Herbivorax sp. ANBcel31]
MLKKSVLFVVVLSVLIFSFSVSTLSASAQSSLLREGMTGNNVSELQRDLNTLGYLNVNPTGYYGSLTKAAVVRLQSEHGAEQDGIAGPITFSIINRLLNEQTSATRSSSNDLLREGMRGSSVTALQQDLKSLGYLHVNPTGYFGTLTKSAVIGLQADNGIAQDGIAGPDTMSVINRLSQGTSADASTASQTATRSTTRTNYLVSWFGGAENILKIGSTAEVYDIGTGRTFNIKRTYGYNHADVETLTAEDTRIMLEIYGGSWSWARRPIIVNVNGRKMAASMAGMPHAGVDDLPANAYVQSRSGGFGPGYNLDAVKGNDMDGVFDIHFLNSRTHGTNRVDTNHQDAVRTAAKWAEKNNF